MEFFPFNRGCCFLAFGQNYKLFEIKNFDSRIGELFMTNRFRLRCINMHSSIAAVTFQVMKLHAKSNNTGNILRQPDSKLSLQTNENMIYD